MISGAGGGTGTFAVQLAKYFGAEVTGVDSTKKLDMLRSIGADHVIDYTPEDYTSLRLAVFSLCQYNVGEQSRSRIHFQP